VGASRLAIIPKKKRRKERGIGDVRRGIALFIVFLSLSIIIHETFHLIVARALGYNADIFYGMGLFNVYGYVHMVPSSQGFIHTILIFCAGGLGTGAVFLILWSTIDDIVAKLLLSFFTSMQLTYGILEPMYGVGLVQIDLLSTWPVISGMVALIIFRIIYWKMGWW